MLVSSQCLSSPKEMSEVSGKPEKIWDWEGKTQSGIKWHFQSHLHKPYKLRKSRISVSLSVTWLIFHPVASRRCLPCCFSFIEQPRKTLYTPKIFVFETLRIGKCIRSHQNASVLNASPFRCDYRVIINLARLSSRCWPHTCDVVFPYSALLLRGPFVASVKKTTSETVNNPFVFWNSQQRSEGNILVALMSSRESKRSILNRNKAQYRVQDLWKNYSTVRWNRWRLFRLILSRWQKCNNSAKSFYSKFWCYFSESVKGLIDICRRTDCC